MGQQKLFLDEGRMELSDFWMPRMCLEQGYVGHPEKWIGWRRLDNGKPIEVDERDVVRGGWHTNGERTLYITGWRDKVYPKIALLPFSLFPATRAGGYLWTALAGVTYILVLCILVRSWKPLFLMMSMPFLFNFERGNPIWLSATFLPIFLVWWDDESAWTSMVAAGCLGVAGALKIAPLALGVLYITKWRWKPVLFCGVVFSALFFIPWIFDCEGFAALATMLRNAREHADFVLRASDFGLVELWRSARVAMGLQIDEPWAGMLIVARISQALGFVALCIGAYKKDYFLLVSGMILAAGNMYYYATLYLLPIFVLEQISKSESKCSVKDVAYHIEILLWLAILSPFQLILLGHSVNQVICNGATLLLMLLRCLASHKELMECAVDAGDRAAM